MGLDVSHDAWHGAYSSFMRFREKLAKIAGFPPLQKMKGFTSDNPISWWKYRKDPLTKLLYHSDCNGYIHRKALPPLAERLEGLASNNLDENLGGHCLSWKDAALQFADGCRKAARNGKHLYFY